MSPAHDSDKENTWDICDGCNSLAYAVVYTPGKGRRCTACLS
jgi:hypothetical protein